MKHIRNTKSNGNSRNCKSSEQPAAITSYIAKEKKGLKKLSLKKKVTAKKRNEENSKINSNTLQR